MNSEKTVVLVALLIKLRKKVMCCKSCNWTDLSSFTMQWVYSWKVRPSIFISDSVFYQAAVENAEVLRLCLPHGCQYYHYLILWIKPSVWTGILPPEIVILGECGKGSKTSLDMQSLPLKSNVFTANQCVLLLSKIILWQMLGTRPLCLVFFGGKKKKEVRKKVIPNQTVIRKKEVGVEEENTSKTLERQDVWFQTLWITPW